MLHVDTYWQVTCDDPDARCTTCTFCACCDWSATTGARHYLLWNSSYSWIRLVLMRFHQSEGAIHQGGLPFVADCIGSFASRWKFRWQLIASPCAGWYCPDCTWKNASMMLIRVLGSWFDWMVGGVRCNHACKTWQDGQDENGRLHVNKMHSCPQILQPHLHKISFQA